MAATRSLTSRQRQAAHAWNELFVKCRQAFTPVEEVVKLAKTLTLKTPIPGMAMADLILRPQPAEGLTYNPLVRDIRLVQALCIAGLVSLRAAASAVLRYASIHKCASADPAIPLPGPAPLVRWTHSWDMDEAMLVFLSRLAADPRAINFGDDAVKLVEVLIEWVQLNVAAWALVVRAGIPTGVEEKNLRIEMDMARVALLALLVMVFEHENVVKTLAHPGAKGE